MTVVEFITIYILNTPVLKQSILGTQKQLKPLIFIKS